MGSLFKSKTTATQSPYEQNPWEPQQSFLKDGFSAAQTAMNNGMNTITGMDMTADMNQGQLDALSGISEIGMNGAQTTADQFTTAGQGALANFGQASVNAQSLFDQAGADPTQGIIDNAAAYSDNPHLQGTIDAALGDVRKAFDGTVGGINAGATGTGNINSTRAGVLESRALDDAMDRGAAVTSSMRGAAYADGLDRATMTAQQGWQNQMAANGMLASTGQAGADMMARGLDTGINGFNQALGANGVLQNQEQAEIEGLIRSGQLPQDLVAKYMATIGGSFGGSGYSTQVTQQASPFQQLAGGAMAIAGLG